MAFDSNNVYLDRAAFNSTTPEFGVAMHKYRSDVDTLGTISASGYFNPLVQPPEANNLNAPIMFQVGDAMLIEGTDGTGYYTVTAIVPNVTITALSVITPAVLSAAIYTTVGGAATEVILLPGLGITAASVVLVQLASGVVSVVSAVAGANQISVTFSADPGNATIINYLVMNAV